MKALALALFTAVLCCFAQAPPAPAPAPKVAPVISAEQRLKFWKASAELSQAQLGLESTPQAAAVKTAQAAVQVIVGEIGKACGTEFEPRQADETQAKAMGVSAGDVICVVKPTAAPMPSVQPEKK